MSEKKFYVYTHRYAFGPKQGQVFYVGKGSGSRSRKTCSRNPYWKNIVNKYGFFDSVLIYFDNEACAFSFERALIEFYRHENLCNMTAGGEGQTGRNSEVIKAISDKVKERWNDEEYRNAIVNSLIGRKQSKETRKKRSETMTGRVRSEDHCRNLSNALKGLKKPEGYAEKVSAIKKGKMAGDKNPSFDWKLRFFYSENECVIATAWHFSELKDLKRYNVDNLIRGKCKSHKGWNYGGLM
jgi:hypothetical protein